MSHFAGVREACRWNFGYSFDYQPSNHETSLYSTVDFDFTKREYYEKAADLINQGNGWLNAGNIKRTAKYSAFDKSLWFFVKDNISKELVALSPKVSPAFHFKPQRGRNSRTSRKKQIKFSGGIYEKNAAYTSISSRFSSAQ